MGVNLFVLGQSSINTYTKANRHTLNELSGNPKKVWPYNVQIYWNALNGGGGGSRNIALPNNKGKRQSYDSPGFYAV